MQAKFLESTAVPGRTHTPRRRDSPGGTSSHKNCERPYRSRHTISPSKTRFSPAMNVSYVISWARSHANQEESSIHSRRDGNSCRNWDETARVIRFTLMSTHTVDSPVSCSSTNRYFVARCNAFLPVQHDIRAATSWSAEANIKKCLGSKIGTGDGRGERTTTRNTLPVESKVSNK